MKIFQPIFRPISPIVKDQIKEFYLLFCCALITSVVGVCLNLLWNIGGLPTVLGCISNIICLIIIPSHEQKKRVALLMIAGFFEGASVGAFHHLVTMMNRGDLILAKAHDFTLMKTFLGSEIAFCCYFGAVTYLTRNKYLYLGGRLSSGLYILILLCFAVFILKGSVISKSYIYIWGLLVPVAQVVVEAMRIMERIQVGDLDHVKHALTLKACIFTFSLSLMIWFGY